MSNPDNVVSLWFRALEEAVELLWSVSYFMLDLVYWLVYLIVDLISPVDKEF